MKNFLEKSILHGVFGGLLLFAATCVFPGTVPRAQAQDRCFGAAGQGCGGWNIGEMPRLAFCVHALGVGLCKVSGGSMTHDPCCATNPRGKMCGGSPEVNECRSEWDRAVSRATWGYQWTRSVDTNLVNNTGRVVRNKYCATSGSGVHRNDTGFCCSSRSRDAWDWEKIGRPSLKICE